MCRADASGSRGWFECCAGIAIDVDEGGAFDAIAALPVDREGGIGFFDVDGFGVAITGEPGGELIGRVEEPGIAGFGREQDKLTDGDDAPVMVGGATLNVADLIGETEALAIDHALAGPRLIGCSVLRAQGRPWTCSPSCSAICWSLSITASTALSFTVT